MSNEERLISNTPHQRLKKRGGSLVHRPTRDLGGGFQRPFQTPAPPSRAPCSLVWRSFLHVRDWLLRRLSPVLAFCPMLSNTRWSFHSCFSVYHVKKRSTVTSMMTWKVPWRAKPSEPVLLKIILLFNWVPELCLTQPPFPMSSALQMGKGGPYFFPHSCCLGTCFLSARRALLSHISPVALVWVMNLYNFVPRLASVPNPNAHVVFGIFSGFLQTARLFACPHAGVDLSCVIIPSWRRVSYSGPTWWWNRTPVKQPPSLPSFCLRKFKNFEWSPMHQAGDRTLSLPFSSKPIIPLERNENWRTIRVGKPTFFSGTLQLNPHFPCATFPRT